MHQITPFKWTARREALLMHMHDKHYTNAQIGRKLGCCPKVVGNKVHELYSLIDKFEKPKEANPLAEMLLL